MKLTQLFQNSQHRPVFIPFLMAGHPNLAATVEIILGFAKLGVSIVEIGVPFSDPVADGPTNQKAAEIALQQGVTLQQCIDMIKQLRHQGCQISIILYGYLNPIMHMGWENFAAQAQQAQIDAALIVDLPPEEADIPYQLLKKHDVGMIFLASPTTDPKRFHYYQQLPPVFLYYVSRLGVTGMQKELSGSLKKELTALKQQLDLPICVGFGISTPEQAHQVGKLCDGVVVGSALVQLLDQTYAKQGITELLQLTERFYHAVNG